MTQKCHTLSDDDHGPDHNYLRKYLKLIGCFPVCLQNKERDPFN